MIPARGLADPEAIWRAWLDARRRALGSPTFADDTAAAARGVLALERRARCALLHEALRGRDRQAAIALLPRLEADDLQCLFADLVFLASFGHGAIQVVRDAIKRLPAAWLAAHLESTAAPLLHRGDWETVRRLLELYIQIDPELTERLAARAATEPDPDTREAGEEFLARLADRTR